MTREQEILEKVKETGIEDPDLALMVYLFEQLPEKQKKQIRKNMHKKMGQIAQSHIDNIGNFLARMEGSKEKKPKCGNDGNTMWCYCGNCKPTLYELPKDFPTPPSEEKKCTCLPHWEAGTIVDDKCTIHGAPTPPDAWEEFVREAWDADNRDVLSELLRTKKKEWMDTAYASGAKDQARRKEIHGKKTAQQARNTTLDEVEKIVEELIATIGAPARPWDVPWYAKLAVSYLETVLSRITELRKQ